MNLGFKTCVRCGTTYEPTGMNQKYCPACATATRREQMEKGRKKYQAKVRMLMAEYNKENNKGE